MRQGTRYLNNIVWQEALDKLLVGVKDWLDGRDEQLPVQGCLGRVIAQPVFAHRSSPHYQSAAMDGYALRAEDTFLARENAPAILTIGSQGYPVDTGDPMPLGCNCVVKIEEVWEKSGKIHIHRSLAPGEHVRSIGEDIVATELLLPANHRIRPVDVSALLNGGVDKVWVRGRPRVAIIPTGSEIIPSGKNPEVGQIIDSNSQLIAGLVEEWGGTPQVQRIVPDDMDRLKEAVKQGIDDGDLVVINAGSSAGREDYTVEVVKALGQVITHGVAIKPGKPTILGVVKGKPVLGLPGYPVSTALTAELFLKPLINKFLRKEEYDEMGEAVMSRQVVSPLGLEEFLRVQLGKVGDKTVATPISRGAGALTSLVKADGIVAIPYNSEGVRAGETVNVRLLRPKEQIANTLVAIGSHDPIMDLLANELSMEFPDCFLSSAHVGSMAGLFALKRKEAHLAPTHLLDPETGEYNLPYLQRYGLHDETILVNLVYREQGLILSPGLGEQVQQIGDLVRLKLGYVNRQPGAGTRLLFDYLLEQQGISWEQIKGYKREEFTHLGVAAVIDGGLAEAGMGIQSAAVAFGLDFIPLVKERYDLAIPKKLYHTKLIQNLLQVMQGESFAKQVQRLPGYDVSCCGQVVFK